MDGSPDEKLIDLPIFTPISLSLPPNLPAIVSTRARISISTTMPISTSPALRSPIMRGRLTRMRSTEVSFLHGDLCVCLYM